MAGPSCVGGMARGGDPGRGHGRAERESLRRVGTGHPRGFGLAAAQSREHDRAESRGRARKVEAWPGRVGAVSCHESGMPRFRGVSGVGVSPGHHQVWAQRMLQVVLGCFLWGDDVAVGVEGDGGAGVACSGGEFGGGDVLVVPEGDAAVAEVVGVVVGCPGSCAGGAHCSSDCVPGEVGEHTLSFEASVGRAGLFDLMKEPSWGDSPSVAAGFWRFCRRS